MPKSSMNFETVIQTINKLLSRENPEVFNSSWILKRAPHCNRFILKNIRTDLGAVDWCAFGKREDARNRNINCLTKKYDLTSLFAGQIENNLLP
jgi:hypothetical protein